MLRRLITAVTLAAAALTTVAAAPAQAMPVNSTVYTENALGGAYTPNVIEKAAPVPVIIVNASTRSVCFTAEPGYERRCAQPGTAVVFTSFTTSQATYEITSDAGAELRVRNIT